MTVVDVRTGGEVLSAGGRLHTFDSIACLTGFLLSGPPGGPRGVWVADYASGRMVPADSARFLRDSRIRSPMDRDGDVIAFAPGVPDSALVSRYGGTVVSWADVRSASGMGEMRSPRASIAPAVPAPR